MYTFFKKKSFKFHENVAASKFFFPIGTSKFRMFTEIVSNKHLQHIIEFSLRVLPCSPYLHTLDKLAKL